jgi:outer membrane receptor for ferric coprogen and ferric-rhodotorulic acid
LGRQRRVRPITSLKHPDGTPANTYVPRRALHLATTWRLPALPALKVGGIAALAGRHLHDRRQPRDRPPACLRRARPHGELRDQPHWVASVNVDNVTDDKHYASLYWTQSYYAAPRNFTASLRWTY